MKNYIVICVLCGLMLPAFGANRSMIAAAPAGNDSVRATAIKNNQFVINNKSNDNVKSSVRKQHGVAVLSAVPVDETPGVSVVDDDPRPADSRILENATKRAACVDNNVGASNTFVWASRNSNTSSYSTMIEDTENPENNVCFVAVSMQSKDSRVNISDIQPRYFAMGDVVNCGSWVDQGVLEKRILDGKKTVRVLSAVGAAVGGAALGVGAMEAFGNKLLAKNDSLSGLEGQRALDDDNLLVSRLLSVKGSDDYNKVYQAIETLADGCKSSNDGVCAKHNWNQIKSQLDSRQ